MLGLAFKLSDPDRLLGGEEELGITCALIPTSTPGVEIGRRHFPLNVPFQNGPTRGKDIFVPIDYIIGGPSMAGQGWRMLVECLSVGRGITLPSNATGGLEIRCHGDWRLRPYSPPVQKSPSAKWKGLKRRWRVSPVTPM